MPNGEPSRFHIGIVGHGFVGQAVEYAFTHPMVDFTFYDPKYNKSIESLQETPIEDQPQCFFICAPTPSNDDGTVNSTIVEAAVANCLSFSEALVVAKPSKHCLLYTSPSPRDGLLSRMPSSA